MLRVKVCLVVGVLFVLAGCSSSGGVASTSALVSDVPSAFARQHSPEVVDLAGAVRADGYPQAERALHKAGFVSGRHRLWTAADGDQLAVTVYTFHTHAGAVAIQRRYDHQVLRQSSKAGKFVPDGLADATGIELAIQGNHQDVLTVAAGPHLITAFGSTRSPDGLRATVHKLITDQYRRTVTGR